jgi:hypothetical protein
MSKTGWNHDGHRMMSEESDFSTKIPDRLNGNSLIHAAVPAKIALAMAGVSASFRATIHPRA